VERCSHLLFALLDPDDSGFVDKNDLATLHGGDDAGVIRRFATDADGYVRFEEWQRTTEQWALSASLEELHGFLTHLLDSAVAVGLHQGDTP